MSSTCTSKGQLTVGVFDSGVGGLSVLRLLVKTAALLDSQQTLRFIYVADTQRFPYGQRTVAQIQTFAAQMIAWLAQKHCDVAVAACHTISTAGASVIYDQSPLPIYDLNQIGSWLVMPEAKNIVVLSTPATASTGVISKSIAASHPESKVFEIGCPELAPIIENGSDNLTQLNQILDEYAKRIKKAGADTVVLGCTHYPLITEKLAQVLTNNINIIDPAVKFADWFFSQLGFKLHEQTSTIAKQRTANSNLETDFYVSGSTSEFKRKLSTYTRELHGTVAPVTIEELEEACRLKFKSSDLALA